MSGRPTTREREDGTLEARWKEFFCVDCLRNHAVPDQQKHDGVCPWCGTGCTYDTPGSRGPRYMWAALEPARPPST